MLIFNRSCFTAIRRHTFLGICNIPAGNYTAILFSGSIYRSKTLQGVGTCLYMPVRQAICVVNHDINTHKQYINRYDAVGRNITMTVMTKYQISPRKTWSACARHNIYSEYEDILRNSISCEIEYLDKTAIQDKSRQISDAVLKKINKMDFPIETLEVDIQTE
jgi:hypothetical protein